jgi:hypothetical protein
MASFIAPAPSTPAIDEREYPIDGFDLIPTEKLIEEETLPHYEAENYYPVHLGTVSAEEYQILAKLGYGTRSAAWLCQNLY